MSKTIEEAAKDHQFFGSYTERQAAYDGSIDGAKYVYKLPLASRLTAEEKERVREMYKVLSECIENRTADVEYLKGKRCQLVIIFGADFFKEEE